MNGYAVHGMDLAPGGRVRIDDGPGLLVYVWEGELWITQDDDSRDHFVRPGRWFRVESHGAALMQATRHTHLTLTAPVPENYARMISVTPAGAAAPSVLYDASTRHRSWLGRLRYRLRFLEKRGLRASTL
jgi:hypothetical protein